MLMYIFCSNGFGNIIRMFLFVKTASSIHGAHHELDSWMFKSIVCEQQQVGLVEECVLLLNL